MFRMRRMERMEIPGKFDRQFETKRASEIDSAKPLGECDAPLSREAGSDVQEVKPPIKNKEDGLERERIVRKELEEKYPSREGYEIISEAYLRDENGKIVRDPETGEARRIDFIVIQDGKVVDSIEVTSKTADKTQQSAKESRIREAGGKYIKDSDSNLVEIPADVQTRIERKD